MDVILLTLPYPPSANRMWRKSINYGAVYLDPTVSQYKRTVRYIAKVGKVRAFANSAVTVVMRVYRPQLSGDLDNRIKCVLDALNGVAYADDKQVVEIHAYRFDDKSNPRVEVEIREREK